MSWLDKIINPTRNTLKVRRPETPNDESDWVRCDECKTVINRRELERNLFVCASCGKHNQISARTRLSIFLDAQGQVELGEDIESDDPLKFKDTKRYKDRLLNAQKASNEKEALIVMAGTVEEAPVVAAAFEFAFIGGSMGGAVGQRFVTAAHYALEQRCALVCFSASGGARMQEGVVSLMQMAKTSAIIQQLRQQHLPFISVLTDPVYGGVMASLASLGDINIAEPGVRAGFAGPEVIRDTIGKELPAGFQRSEFLLKHGAIDMIVERKDLTKTIARLIKKLMHKEGS